VKIAIRCILVLFVRIEDEEHHGYSLSARQAQELAVDAQGFV
jgi:hypothetical protein